MTDKTIYAWTSVGDYRAYPQYLNISRRGGQVEITVRAPEDLTGGHPVVGTTAKCTVPDEVLVEALLAMQSASPRPTGDVVEVLLSAKEVIKRADNSSGYCCCGSVVEAHGMGDGHGPVDQGEYVASHVLEQIDAALATLQPADPKVSAAIGTGFNTQAQAEAAALQAADPVEPKVSSAIGTGYNTQAQAEASLRASDPSRELVERVRELERSLSLIERTKGQAADWYRGVAQSALAQGQTR